MQSYLLEPQLRDERERAKKALDELPIWSEWKAAHTWALWAVDTCVRDRDACACTDPVLLVDQLLDVEGDLEALDELSPVLQTRAAMHHVEDLERQVVATEQWRGFQEAQRRLQEVQSDKLLEWTRAMEQRLAAARVRPRTGPPYKQAQPPARSLPASSSSTVQSVQPAHPASTLTSTSAGSAWPSDRVSGIAFPTGPHSPVLPASSFSSAQPPISASPSTSPRPSSALPSYSASSSTAIFTEPHSPVGVAALPAVLESSDVTSSTRTDDVTPPAASAEVPHTTAPSNALDASPAPSGASDPPPPAPDLTFSAGSPAPAQSTHDSMEVDTIPLSTPPLSAASFSSPAEFVHMHDDDEDEVDYGENGDPVQLEPVRGTRDSDPATKPESGELDSHLSAEDGHMEPVHDGQSASTTEAVASNDSHHPSVRLDTASLDQRQTDNHGNSVLPRGSRKRVHISSHSEDERDRSKRVYRTSAPPDSRSELAGSSREDDKKAFVACADVMRIDDLHEIFSRFGSVKKVDMPSRPKGEHIAFIHFFDDRHAWAAIREGIDHAAGISSVPARRRCT